jgi:hypothetical protein
MSNGGWVERFPIWIETSVGRVGGQLWSDGVAALVSRGDRASSRTVHSAGELAALLAAVGVPEEEAGRIGADLWRRRVGGPQ